jgi:SpoVK/Ycf46/Vps4 family AAA+-type ATPase
MKTMDWMNLPAEEARVKVANADFEAAAAKRKPSVDAATLQRYEAWKREKGAD